MDEILAKDVEVKPSNLDAFIDFTEPSFEELVVHQSNRVLDGFGLLAASGLDELQAEVRSIDVF